MGLRKFRYEGPYISEKLSYLDERESTLMKRESRCDPILLCLGL